MNVPWIEKYRPKSIDQLHHQKEAKTLLNNCILTKNVPHLLLCGDNGTGKTSASLAFCKQLFEENYTKNKVLILNSNDDRGIANIRENIKTFSQNSVNDKLQPQFKIIVLDEVDSMTIDAQSALRRIMETTSHITRFILICNRINNIIDPIISRCTTVMFKKHSEKSMMKKMREIIDAEEMDIPEYQITMIAKNARGDMRNCIKQLQLIKMIGEEYYESVPDVKTLMLNISKNKKVKVRELVEQMVSKGYPAKTVIKELYSHVLNMKIGDDKISKIVLLIGEHDVKISKGGDEYIILLGLTYHMCDVF